MAPSILLRRTSAASKCFKSAMFRFLVIISIFPVSLVATAGLPGDCVYDPLGALRPSTHEICFSSEGRQLAFTFKDGVNHWSPWAYPPFCVRGSTQIDKYCVYTSADFNSNAGISFIIRPDTVPGATAFIRDDSLTKRGKKHLKSQSTPHDVDVAYEVRDIPGKGQGVIASRSIRRGEIFMVGVPAVVIDQELEIGPDPEVSEADRLQLHKLAFEQLPNRERALSLAASTGGNIYEDIMKTNGFGIDIGNRKHSGLFPETAVSFLKRRERWTGLTPTLEIKPRLCPEVSRGKTVTFIIISPNAI